MKDFKNPNLYKLEQGTFETFVDSMLETNSEYNQSGRLRSGLVEQEEEETDYFGSIDDWGSTDAMDGFDFDFSSGLDNYSSDLSDKLVNPRGYTLEEMGTLKMLMTAPIHALQQAGDAVVNTKKLNGKTRKAIAKDWRLWGLGLGVFSFLGLLPGVTSFIYLPVGIALLLSSGLADYVYGKHGGESVILKLIQGDEDDFVEGGEDGEDNGSNDLDNTSDGLGGDDTFGLSGDDSFGLGGDFGGFDDFKGFGDDEDDTFGDRYEDFVDDEKGSDDEEDYYDPEAMGARATDFFPASPIATDTTEAFREGLLDVYKSGLSAKGKMLHSRGEIVKYYAKYMPNNDKAFSRWTSIKEHSPEYDNVAYTIYKSLVSVEGRFDMKNAVPHGDKLVVMEMKRTPLIYKITVKLPSYFKINTVTTRSNVFNDMLKASDDDEKVGTILTTYGGDLVIKFLRLDYKKLVSMGDLLRLNDESATESFAEKFASSKGVPMVAGMRDNEYPYMVDIVGNPAASIVGGSGSGKSWLTFQFMDSMLIANNPERVNFLILDAKDAAIWKQFALTPHVIGYHSDYNDFYDILLEVKAEHERRMAELSRMGIESWKDYTSRAERSGDTEKLADMPLLFVIIDEITYTMSSLQNEDDEKYKELKNILTQLSSVIRASGIRLMLIGQRAIDTSIPKGFMANSPLKLAMKMNVQSDFTTMLGKGYDREVSRIPSGPGEGIMLAEGQTKPSYVKTVIPGGKDDGDILMQVRVLALDWVRRTQGTQYDYTSLFSAMRTTIKKGFNRDMYYNQSLKAIEEGRITDPVDVDEAYLIAVNSPQANLIDNAVQNVERKLSYRDEKTVKRVNDYDSYELEELEPEELEELEEQEPEEFDFPELDFPETQDYELEEPELEEFSLDDEPELEEPDVQDFELAEPELEDEPELEMPELDDFDWGSLVTEPDLGTEEFDSEELGSEEELYSEEHEPEEQEEHYSVEIEVGYEEQEEFYTEEDELEEVNVIEPEKDVDFRELTLEELLAQEEEELREEPDEIKEPDEVEEFDYTQTEEYQRFLRDKEELEELKRQQKEQLATLQRQKELKRQRELEEQKLKKEQEEKRKLEAERAKIKAERDEIERQKQEILKLQRELEEQEESNKAEEVKEEVKEKKPEPVKSEGSVENKEVTKEVSKPKPQPKPTVRAKPKTKEVSKPVAVRDKPKPKPKVTKDKEVVKSVKEQPNTVNYQEMENMSVSQYVAKFGEVANGQRRVKSQVLQAKFNRRKVSLAIAVGEIYEEGEYFYYVG